MSKVTILLGSTRRDGNTALLAKSFAEGAVLHNEVETISVADYSVLPCTGCNACRKDERHICPQKDDMAKIYEKLRKTEVLVIASPVYFYGISAKLKAIIDRLHNPVRNTFQIKKMVLLSVGADTLPELFDSILLQYHASLQYFHLQDLGTVLVYGVEAKGAIKDKPELQKAYELGASIQ